ncbi:Iron uptake system EfeUOB, component EfeO/EfeM [Tistlia consotensis]|uniref:Iron uptake system EfeUOB, component EfeO/EfeM n=1 Tax=Tistlia consotensis USBA 355 TaxID=560819 RepID=A0A1Y6BCH5_9PROT|nr:iron uptake system protein EfeO [Tistlia consotensis]SME96678.1 Iron uptake system EfeUOB, component EfeO/EfeM [Tistlia consotensis USBA 355]SNR56043.1 Iron uptake system EfeUOB, component EfeO/EfeM [Tistlia consotensis]
MSEEAKAPGGRTPLRLAVLGSALLAVAGAGAFYDATLQRGTRAGSGADGAYRVAITASACEPNVLSVPAGRRAFAIDNRSDRPVEWEILQGVMVVEERENIVPGLSQTVTARLAPGDYEMTCGLLSNPRGRLHVTATEASAAAAVAPTLKAFIGPLSEYKVFLGLQGAELLRRARQLAAAIEAGDLAKARTLYQPARLPYERIAASAARFADLQDAIDPAAAYLARREQDPAFTGFHRLEYGLFGDGAAEGAAPLVPVAERLVADLSTLNERLRALTLTPADLADDAARLAGQLASARIPAGEDRYAGGDLADLEAGLAGIGKIVGLLEPLVRTTAPAVADELKSREAVAEAAVRRLHGPDGFPSYDKVGADDRRALAAAFQALAESLKKLNPAMGLA